MGEMGQEGDSVIVITPANLISASVQRNRFSSNLQFLHISRHHSIIKDHPPPNPKPTSPSPTNASLTKQR
jgi:hypothetical protein